MPTVGIGQLPDLMDRHPFPGSLRGPNKKKFYQVFSRSEKSRPRSKISKVPNIIKNIKFQSRLTKYIDVFFMMKLKKSWSSVEARTLDIQKNYESF
jgi:hypothetical protein